MELGELLRTSALDLGTQGTNIEYGVIALVGVLVLALLAAKARRAYKQKMRKAASSGYYDYDVARYGGSAPGRSLIEATETAGPQPVSSTFSAPKRGSRRKDRAATAFPPVPPPMSPNSPDTDVTYARVPPPPPPSAPLPPPPLTPTSVGSEDPQSEGSALPLLVPPPPPASSIPPPPRG